MNTSTNGCGLFYLFDRDLRPHLRVTDRYRHMLDRFTRSERLLPAWDESYAREFGDAVRIWRGGLWVTPGYRSKSADSRLPSR